LSASPDLPVAGLRERKKAKTREAIQRQGLRLFREHGFDATTVEQIAAAADISESTFFRYFPTKAEVVLQDDFDPLIVQAFRDQPAELGPIPALRGAFRTAFAQLSPGQMEEQRERMDLILSVVELRAAMLDQFAEAMSLLAAVVAERAGRPAEDFAVRTLAGAVVGVAMAVMFTLAEDPEADLASLFDQGIAHLEAGLEL
jgi:AcrR family transcriptional regulator